MRRTERLALTFAILGFAAAGCGPGDRADATDRKQVARGKIVYQGHCAACHGANLEGQPRWRERLPNGKLPAPPHDATGHTWEHPDPVLFDVVKGGVARKAGPGYKSDMPAFGGLLADEDIWAVIAYIKSNWPERLRRKREPQR